MSPAIAVAVDSGFAETPETTSSADLMDLPTEVRQKILRHLLHTDYVREEKWNLGKISSQKFIDICEETCSSQVALTAHLGVSTSSKKPEHHRRVKYHLKPAILQCCKKLYREGREVLCNENKFVAVFGFAESSYDWPTVVGTALGFEIPKSRYSELLEQLTYKHGARPMCIPLIRLSFGCASQWSIVNLIPVADLKTTMRAYAAVAVMKSEMNRSLDATIWMRLNAKLCSSAALDGRTLDDIWRAEILPQIGRWLDADHIDVFESPTHSQEVLSTAAVKTQLARFRAKHPIEDWLARLNSYAAELAQLEHDLDTKQTPKPAKLLLFVLQTLIEEKYECFQLWLSQEKRSLLHDLYDRFIAEAARQFACVELTEDHFEDHEDQLAWHRYQLLYAYLARQSGLILKLGSHWNLNMKLRIACLWEKLGESSYAIAWLHKSTDVVDQQVLADSDGDLVHALAELGHAAETDASSMIATPNSHIDVSAFAVAWSKHPVFGRKRINGIVDAHTQLISVQRTKNGGWW